jgi:hypothetical protein
MVVFLCCNHPKVQGKHIGLSKAIAASESGLATTYVMIWQVQKNDINFSTQMEQTIRGGPGWMGGVCIYNNYNIAVGNYSHASSIELLRR